MQSGENAALLLDYCARKLDSARAAALEAHIDICPSCRQFRDAQRLVWDSLDSWNLSDSGWEFNHRLRQRLEAEDAAPQWLDNLRTWRGGISWKPAIPLAAALALWLAIFPPSNSNSDTPPSDQIEVLLEDAEMLRQLPLEAR